MPFILGGGYCLYCNDRDLIYPDKLDAFIDFLEEHPNYSCGWVSRVIPDVQEKYTEYSTVEAFLSMCWRCEHPTGFFFNSKYLQDHDESEWTQYIQPEGWTAFPFENIQAELVIDAPFVRYNIPVWRSTGDETHNKYVSGFEKLKTDGDRWFYTENCINRGKAYLDQFWNICKVHGLSVGEGNRWNIYSNIILGEQKIGVWRFKQIFESDSLAYHYAVEKRKVSGRELKHNGDVIVETLLNYVYATEGNRNLKQRVLNIIKASDIRTRKILFVSKYFGPIIRSKIVRKIRGKQ